MFYIAQYPVRWTGQSAYNFPPLADLLQPVGKIDHYLYILDYYRVQANNAKIGVVWEKCGT